MEVLQGLGALPIGEPRVEGETAVTIGFFDGVHRGHQTVMRRTVDVARERGLQPVAITFDRHPREILTPGTAPRLLTTLRRKAELIDALGLERLLVLAFDEGFAATPAEEFVDRVLVQGLNVRHAVVGANFTFGHKAAGNLEVLTELGHAWGFGVEGVTLLELGGRRVSSTSIREALEAGDLAWPRTALARPYSVEGQVVPGAGRGAGLGFPTANLQTPPRILLPKRGVYAGRGAIGGRSWAAAINVGINPTFGEEPLHVEAFLLEFDGDISGEILVVEFWERLRDEVRFESPEALAAQIREDVERTRALVPPPGGSGG